MTVRTRFAPSPTGLLHIGGIRTALFSWLHARHHKGRFILRIEDTDRERSTDAATRVILEGMSWLGLKHDEGPYYQTRRFDRYRQVINRLLETGNAYYCNCSKERLEQIRNEAISNGKKPRYDGYCRTRDFRSENSVIRFWNPVEGKVIVNDQVQGNVVFENAELDDLIIARQDGSPTYHLTVVVDDMDMQITHVIRGDDHLNNMPRQINIFRALDREPPIYAHIPMILGPEGKKLSKRDGAASVLQYREEGYLPEALLNYLVRLGWSKGDQEIFSIEQMIADFEISDVNRAACNINPGKLLWLNQYYLKNADSTNLANQLDVFLEKIGIDINTGPSLNDVVEVHKQRADTIRDMLQQSIIYYQDFAKYEPGAAKKHLRPIILEPLIALYEALNNLQRWQNSVIRQVIEYTAEEFAIKMGKLAQPLRVAVTGRGVSPDIGDTLRLLGREKTLKRLWRAIEFIRNRSEPRQNECEL